MEERKMNSIIQMDHHRIEQHSHYAFFDLYDKNSFKQPPRTTWMDGWKIEYMAIARPETLHMTPMVIIGGAFQNFNSYKYCVEQLFAAGGHRHAAAGLRQFGDDGAAVGLHLGQRKAQLGQTWHILVARVGEIAAGDLARAFQQVAHQDALAQPGPVVGGPAEVVH